MALILLPLVFSLVAWFVPSSFTRIFGLIASAITLALSAVAVCSFDANEPLNIDFGNSSSFVLSFITFSIDSLGFTMLLLTNAVVLLVFLSNYTRSITAEKRFTAHALLMQFGLVGVFTINTILGLFIVTGKQIGRAHV